MSVIFDLKESSAEWADSVNESLVESWPEYINEHGKVGSDGWWKDYDSGLIPKVQKSGVVSFIGKRQDFLNEEWDTVEIEHAGAATEYDHLGYWKNHKIVVGSNVLVESFEISFQNKYGPMIFIFERLVQVAER